MKPKLTRRKRKIKKIRSKIKGSNLRPRITVFRSNKRIYAHAIDDEKAITIAQSSDLKLKDKITKVERAKKVGQVLGATLVKLGIKRVVFDRRGYKFHGRVKAIAEGLKEKGVNF